MIADVYGKNVKTMLSNEGASLGAAILGGVAAGVYSSVADGCEKAVKESSSISADMEKHGEYMKYYGVYKSIYPGVKDCFKQLKEI